MVAPWKKLASEIVSDNRIFRLRRDRVVNPRTGAPLDAYVLESPDWVNVIPLTPDDEVVLVRQFRHGVGAVTLEIPGGLVDPGETPIDAARRELMEETGCRAGELLPIGVVDAQPAIQDNRLHTFLARGVVPEDAPAPDEGEDLEVVTVPLASIPGRIRSGEISHALVVMAFHWLRLWETDTQGS